MVTFIIHRCTYRCNKLDKRHKSTKNRLSDNQSTRYQQLTFIINQRSREKSNYNKTNYVGTNYPKDLHNSIHSRHNDYRRFVHRWLYGY